MSLHMIQTPRHPWCKCEPGKGCPYSQCPPMPESVRAFAKTASWTIKAPHVTSHIEDMVKPTGGKKMTTKTQTLAIEKQAHDLREAINGFYEVLNDDSVQLLGINNLLDIGNMLHNRGLQFREIAERVAKRAEQLENNKPATIGDVKRIVEAALNDPDYDPQSVYKEV